MQTYQEVTKEMIKEIENLGEKDPQKYFWNIKKEQPERFERLRFDTNGHEPYSETVGEIMFDLLLAGIYNAPWKYKN